MASLPWHLRYGKTSYVVGSISLLLSALIGSNEHGLPVGLAVYVFLLGVLCAVPQLVMKSLNGRYALLSIFMGLYWVFFGVLDLQHLLLGSDIPQIPRDGFLTLAECAVLLGAALVLGGYFAGMRVGARQGSSTALAEWPTGTMLFVGLAVYLLGSAAEIYFQVFVAPEKTAYSAGHGLEAMGPILTFIVMLGHMMQPLGILILAYGYAKQRGSFWNTLILVIVAAQIILGFIEDVKLQAILGGALVIMCRTLIDNRTPKWWIFGGVVFAIFAFPIFQAYRTEVTGERGLNRAQAFYQLDKVLDIVLASRDKVSEGRPGERAQTFLERASGKDSLEVLFKHVGEDVDFLHGQTLVAIPMAFVPRLLAPDKEDVSAGLLFSKLILKGDDNTYISISNLGELYWNFGWPGVFLGMPLIGFLLGFVGTRFTLENGTSLTRILVLLVTAQTLCMGFGGVIPIAYIVWLRSMAAIGLMHLVFARRTVVVGPTAVDGAKAPEVLSFPAPIGAPGGGSRLALPGPRFPNIMR